jgi:long-chain fatty acid transport protein
MAIDLLAPKRNAGVTSPPLQLILKLNPRQFLKPLAITMASLPVLKVAANGFALPDQDAFATGRGEAVVATPDNPSTIYYNPAGITQLQGNNFRAGAYLLDYHFTFNPPPGKPNTGQSYDEQDNFAAVPRFFYSFASTNSPVSFGLGIYSPFGGKISWPQDTGFRAVAISGQLKYITINPVVAYKILPSLSVGAGPMFNYVDLETDQGLRPFSGPNNFFRFSGSGWSYGANAGILWQPLDELSFGTMFRSPAKVTLEGYTGFEREPLIAKSSRSANMDLNFPMTIVSGVSWRPTQKWNLEFDANYTDWSSFGRSTLHQSSPPFPLHSDVPVTLDWQSSWMYEFGATRYFDNGWRTSLGYCFNQNSVPNGHYTPFASDLDRHFFSVGTGWQGKHWSFDAAYQFGYGPDHTVAGSTPSSTPGQAAGQNADGKYKFYSNALSLSVGYRF